MNNFLNRNLTAKIISILFALVMWTYVMSEINPPTTRTFADVPVEVKNLEALKEQGLVVVGSTEHTIRANLKGRRDEVYSIEKSDIKASVDLMGYRVGVNNIPVEINSFPNIETDFSPKTIRIELEEIIPRQKEVVLEITGNPKAGYALNEAQYKPTVVMVEGPESLVNSVDRVVARLEIKEQSEDIVVSLPLKAVNKKGQEVTNVDVKTAYIDVFMPIDRLKTVKIDPEVRAQAAPGYVVTNIDVIPDEVPVRGKAEVIANLTSLETETLSFDNLSEGLEQEISVKLPEGVLLFDEEKITLKIEVKPTAEKNLTLAKENVTFLGLEEGMTIDSAAIPEQIELKVVAAKDHIDSLEDSDVQLVVDVTDLKEGVHEIVPQLTVDGISADQIKASSINPGSFSIRIIEEN